MQKARSRKRPSADKANPTGRISKKISEIWGHYRAFPERGAVECVYCWKLLKRTDSSTKNMWGHMKAFHADMLVNTKPAPKESKKGKGELGLAIKKEPDSKVVNMSTNDTIGSIISSVAAGGVLKLNRDESILDAVTALTNSDKTPTQPYVKRARAGTGTSGADTPMTPQPLATGTEQATDLAKKPFSFLESIPKINEVLNISAGFTATTKENENVEQILGTHEVPCAPSGSHGDDSPIQADDCSSSEGIPSANSPPNIPVNPLSSLLCSVAANPLAYMTAMQALVGSSSLLQQYQLRAASSAVCENIALPTPIGPALSPSSAFTLNEGSCVTQLMKMAIDLDLTMSYHRRRGDVEMCFESNRTAEKSGARGKVLCLTDCGREIRVTERTNGNVTESELWTKTDFSQFHWAIRGRCQKLLLR
ncbi:unnamed protein product, partial [Mesorhabditis belari]|uniref:BED-type domain-containing protein n=1 Tax=Mesorhabditis belari TaxID=2138241 RepID=A0AAF3J1C8_9BILA